MNDTNPLRLVDRLLSCGVSLVVIGGHAVNVHGFARATEDIDIVFKRTSESEVVLAEVLAESSAYYIGDEIDPTTGVERTYPVTLDHVRSRHLMMLGTDSGFVDLFDFVPALPHVSVEELLEDPVIVEGRPFVNLKILRLMKAAADRPQDRIDLENLPALD